VKFRSELISDDHLDAIVVAALLVETDTSEFANDYCDKAGLYSEERMEVTSCCFSEWHHRRYPREDEGP
jgi:hypothetical protein